MIIIHTTNLQIIKKIKNKITGDLINNLTHFRILNPKKINLNHMRDEFKIDINYLSPEFNINNIKAFVSDMDSTLINIECIDEIAKFAGVKPQVAKITAQAMRGEINFDTALMQRVKLITGVHINDLEQIFNHRLKINTGGEKLINFLFKKNIKTAVVSGGFSFFTDKLKKKLNLNYQLANDLEFNKKTLKLTGNLINKTIVNANTKAEFVNNLAFNNQQIITCGDGANDLKMMKISGLSIAYHAKEIVNKQADIIIKFGGLDKIIDLF